MLLELIEKNVHFDLRMHKTRRYKLMARSTANKAKYVGRNIINNVGRMPKMHKRIRVRWSVCDLWNNVAENNKLILYFAETFLTSFSPT